MNHLVNLCHLSEFGTLIIPSRYIKQLKPKGTQTVQVRTGTVAQMVSELSETWQSDCSRDWSYPLWEQTAHGHRGQSTISSQPWFLGYNNSSSRQSCQDGKRHCPGLDGSSYGFRFCVFNIYETLNLVETENTWKMTSLAQGWSWNAWLECWPHPPFPPFRRLPRPCGLSPRLLRSRLLCKGW